MPELQANVVGCPPHRGIARRPSNSNPKKPQTQTNVSASPTPQPKV